MKKELKTLQLSRDTIQRLDSNKLPEVAAGIPTWPPSICVCITLAHHR